MYRIRGADQQEYGPVTVEVLRQWIAEGRATASSQVQKEGTSEWHSLQKYPEFQTALAAAQAGAGTSPSAKTGKGYIAGAKPSRALSLTSLIFGALGVFPFGLIAGLPAIITGHFAYRRNSKDPSQFGGRRMALAGLILGYLSILTTIGWAMMATRMPMVAQRQRMQGAFYASCQGNLKQLWFAAQVFANGHRDELPPDYLSMKGDVAPGILVCPNDKSKTAATNWAEVGPENISYEFLSPSLKVDSKITSAIIFRCPIHGTAIYGNGRFRIRRGNGSQPAPLTNSAPSE